ncbi:hypothetical protein IW261DRAFT_693149 [Armillaria novae-zelandiae]|uniref:RING-type domain-containing protein n=1 Tax=Armillaria novae-zelandiae TaxID=153914 RepID=A0AA39T9C3_9AGAR|nr:hypothetical protein IW261DRAFT_693149 [Armillaria novae-zelandiae]
MERLQSDVPRPEREPDSDDEWQELALPPGRGRFSSSRHADAWSELFDRPESHSNGQEDLTFRYPVRVLPNYSSSDRTRGNSTTDALRERRLAYLLRRGSESSSYHNISASRPSPSHSPVRRSSSLNDHPSRPSTDEYQRNGRVVPRPPERHLSVDFFDSRSSTISDMARAVTRTGRQENSPFYSDPLLSRQPSTIPPSIPPPDLGAIFIPHTSDPAEPEPYGLPPLPPVDPTVSELLNYERGTSPERRPPAPTPSRQSAAALRPDTISIDPNAFAPGPFRNTMIWQADRIRARQQSEASHPPSIPPLPFEDDLPPSRSRAEERLHPMDRFYRNPPEHLNAIGDRLPPRRTNMAYGRTAPDSAARRVAEEEPPRRSSSDIHSYLSRRARMEASRLEQAAVTSAASGPDMDGFSHALEVLRHDGLTSTRSRQLIDRYHEQERQRERERADTEQQQQQPQPQPQPRREERRTATSTVFRGWGDIDESGRSASRPPSYPVRRRPSPPRPAGSRPSAEPLPSRAAAARGSRNNSRYIRAHHHEGYSSLFRPLDLYNLEFIHAPWRVRRARPGGFGMGDFVRDEDFDDSYEGLLSLSSILGDVPKATPADVISGMKTGLFKDWSTSDSDHRCPICLDDYSPTDSLMKLNDCSHWLHKECLEQWLKGARTCPVCRKAVKGPSPPQNRCCPRHSHQPTQNPPGPRRRDEDDDEGNDANPAPRPDGNNSSGAGIGLGGSGRCVSYLSQWLGYICRFPSISFGVARSKRRKRIKKELIKFTPQIW